MIKYSQSTQSNKFVISLQYLQKKEVRKGVHFLHADEHQSFYKLGLLFLMEVARYVQITQNRKLVIFLQRVLQLLLCSFVIYCDGLEGLKVPKLRFLGFWQKSYPFRYTFLFQHEVPMFFFFVPFTKRTCLQKYSSFEL